MFISVHCTVEQIACWIDEQLCARQPLLKEQDRTTRILFAALSLGMHGRTFIEIKNGPGQSSINPSDRLLDKLGASTAQLPSRVIEIDAATGASCIDAAICIMLLDEFGAEIFGPDSTNFLPSYLEVMKPVLQGYMRVGGWNREGRLRLYPTELGRESGQVPRRRVVLSQIGQHLSH